MLEQINFIAQYWFDWMYSMFWQISLLILFVSLIDLLIKKWAWPQVRYTLWILILVKLIIPPTWTFSGSIIPNLRSEVNYEFLSKSEPIENVITEKQINKAPVESKTERKQLTKTLSENSLIENQQTASVFKQLDWKFYVMAVWLLGIIVFALLLANKISKFKKWHIEQKETKNIPEWFHNILIKSAKTLSLERLPAIVFSNEVFSPAVYGIFRPVLLLPEKYIEELSKDEAEHILLHELAHVKRGDLIVHGICLYLQIIYWFNPLLIWTRKQMKHVREICCDITIANILKEKTKSYKDTLVNTARKLLTKNTEPAMGLLGLFEEPYQLISRLNWLNKETWKTQRMASITAVLSGLLFTAFVLPMGEYNFIPSPVITPIVVKDYDENNDYKSKIEELTQEINNAFINWDLKKIEEFYTDDAIIDEIQHPTVEGKDNIMSYLEKEKASGRKFHNLQNYITDFWKDGRQLHSVESFLFTMTIENPKLKLSGSGSSYVIWEIQEDQSIKIKYSILNLDNSVPEMIIRGERK